MHLNFSVVYFHLFSRYKSFPLKNQGCNSFCEITTHFTLPHKLNILQNYQGKLFCPNSDILRNGINLNNLVVFHNKIKIINFKSDREKEMKMYNQEEALKTDHVECSQDQINAFHDNTLIQSFQGNKQ